MGNKTKGLLALLGIGALAWWRYKKATPEQQQKVKDTFNAAKEKFTKQSSELMDKANEALDQLKNKAENLKK